MKVTVNGPPVDVDGKKYPWFVFSVLFEGELVGNVQEADDEEGYILQIPFAPPGQIPPTRSLVVRDPETGQGHLSWPVKRVGKVEIQLGSGAQPLEEENPS